METVTNPKQNPALIRKFNRFFILVELMDLSRTILKPDLSQNWKFRMNNLVTHLIGFRKEFLRKADDTTTMDYEDHALMYWQLLDEFDKCENKPQLLALITAYNSGEITLNNEPLNEAA